MPQTLSVAGRRYVARFGACMSAYVGAVLAAPWLFARTPAGPLQVAVAIAPALAIVGVIWAIGRYLVEEQDEYVRMRLAQVVIFATGLTLSFCSVWGFLEGFGLLPHLATYDVVPAFFGFWGVSQLVRRVSGR